MVSVLTAFADDVTLTVKAPSTVEVGDNFRIQFVLNTQGAKDFTAPDFKGFEVLYGPSTSSQSSFQIINGHTTQSSSITYTFIVLSSTPGTYTLGSASVQVGGNTIKSKPVKINVLPVGQGHTGQQGSQRGGGQQSSQSQQQSAPSSSGGGISSSDLFMTATASRTNIYEQEAVLVTYKLYTLVNITQLDGKLPTLDGFHIQEIELPHNKQLELERYNGRNYRSVVWAQYVLFPQKSGKLEIPSITYEGVVQQVNRNIDPIDAFFNGMGAVVETKKKILTPKIVLNVSPLPAKPDGFSGAVGKFEATSSISTTEVTANDAITLKVRVKGVGNMKLIEAPQIDFPKDFDIYDPKVNDKLKLTTSGQAGSKEFEYVVVPRHGGEYKIPAVRFTYFDVEKRKYATIETEEYNIKVKKGSGDNSQSVSYTNQQQDVEQLASDIRFIKLGDSELRPLDAPQFFPSWNYLLSYIIAILVFVVCLVLGMNRMKRNSDIARVRGRGANKKAVKRMKQARRLLSQNKVDEFYDETLKALWGYIADTLNMPVESLNKDNIQSALVANGVSQEHIDGFISTLSDCEFARYAPGDKASNMQSTYDSAIQIISKMEENI